MSVGDLTALAAVLAGFELESLLALLYAACSSPACRRRLPTMTALWAACAARPPSGRRRARPRDLPCLADAAVAMFPALEAAEDWTPHDPAAGAVAHAPGFGAFPVHPGALADPLGTIETIRSYGRAVDPVLRPRHGYGLADVLAAAAALLADQHDALAASWAPGTAAERDDAPAISAAEHDAAARWLARAAVDPGSPALAAATADAADLTVTLAWPFGLLGPVVAVRGSGRLLPVPAGLVLSGAAAAADRLLSDARGSGRRDRRRIDAAWRREADFVLADAASRLDAHVFHPVRVARAGRRRMTLVVVAHRHAYLFETVAAADPRTLARRAARARRRAGLIAARRTLLLRLPSWDPPPAAARRRGLLWAPGLADAFPFGRRLPAGWRRLAPGTVLRTVVLVHGPADPVTVREPGGRYAGVVELPLQVFRDAAAGAAQAEVPGELWAFVDELASFATHGVDAPPVAFHAMEAADLWTDWAEAGLLAPAWRPEHAVVAAAGAASADRWAVPAARAGLDALLIAVGLPPSPDWAHVSDALDLSALSGRGLRGWTAHGRDAASLSMFNPPAVAFASVVDELVVSVLLDGLPQRKPRLIAFADALHAAIQQAAHQQTGWDRWRAAFGDSPVHVEIDPDAPSPEAAAVWPASCGPGHVVLGVDISAADLVDDAELHRQAGDALARAVGVLLGDRGGEQPDEEFGRAWSQVPPTLERQSLAHPFRAAVLAPGLALSRPALRRAARSIAAGLRGQVEPGDHPHDLARLVVAPAALQTLRRAFAPFDAEALLDAVCAEAERAAADRFSARERRRAAVRGRWAGERMDALLGDTGDDEAVISRSAELLVEAVLRDPPAGALVPDRVDTSRLMHLAWWALELSMRDAHASAGLQPAVLRVAPHGAVALVPAGDPSVNVRGWRDAQWASDLRHAARGPAREPDEEPPAPGEDAPFAGIRNALQDIANGQGRDAELSRRMLAVDDALVAECGFGLDATKAVLDTAIAQATAGDPLPPLGRTRAGDLSADAASWAGLPVEQTNAAVARLTLATDALQAAELRYWQLEQRDSRLALRPLVAAPPGASDPRLRILPRKSFASRDVLIRYLEDGRLPWPPSALSPKVNAAVDRWRQHAEKSLELDTVAAAGEAGLVAVGALSARRAAGFGLDVPGEIDVLAVDSARGRIWVVECKHLREPFGPVEIARHVAAFYGAEALPGAADALRLNRRAEDAYVSKLLAKTGAVSADPAAAVRAVGGDATSTPPFSWTVVPAVVTYHVEVAAFASAPRVAFAEALDAAAMFAEEAVPGPGWWSASRPQAGAAP